MKSQAPQFPNSQYIYGAAKCQLLTMDRSPFLPWTGTNAQVVFRSGLNPGKGVKSKKKVYSELSWLQNALLSPPPLVINHAMVDSAIKTDFDKWEICHFANTVCTMADGFDRIVSSPL